MPMRTVNVVFVESSEEMFDESTTLFDKLYNVEGVVLHGATHESVWAVAEHLSQWDNGELDEREDSAEPGNYEDVWDCRINGTLYTLYAHRSIGYVGLNAHIDGPCAHGSRDAHCADCEAGR
jgi:hypothetical protein